MHSLRSQQYLFTAVDLRNWLLNFCEISIQSNVKPIKKSIRRKCRAASQIHAYGSFYCANRPCPNALSTTSTYRYRHVPDLWKEKSALHKLHVAWLKVDHLEAFLHVFYVNWWVLRREGYRQLKYWSMI